MKVRIVQGTANINKWLKITATEIGLMYFVGRECLFSVSIITFKQKWKLGRGFNPCKKKPSYKQEYLLHRTSSLLLSVNNRWQITLENQLNCLDSLYVWRILKRFRLECVHLSFKEHVQSLGKPLAHMNPLQDKDAYYIFNIVFSCFRARYPDQVEDTW